MKDPQIAILRGEPKPDMGIFPAIAVELDNRDGFLFVRWGDRFDISMGLEDDGTIEIVFRDQKDPNEEVLHVHVGENGVQA